MQQTDTPSRSRQPLSKPNGRLGSKKSKTGCLTCKERKVKCDETKPACKRCSDRGLACGGYTDIFISTAVADEWATSTTPLRAPHGIAPERALVSFKASNDERRTFDFYRDHVSTILGGALDSSFWTGILPQISQSEMAVRHAVVAVGACYERLNFPRDDRMQQAQQLCITSYNKALSTTAKRLTEPGSDIVALSTCVLFLCIEFLQGSSRQALELLHRGAGLLRRCIENYSSRRGPDHTWPTGNSILDGSVIPLFERLVVLSALFGDRPISFYVGTVPDCDYLDNSDNPTFQSIIHARNVLYRTMADAHTVIRRLEIYRFGLPIEPELLRQHTIEKELCLAALNNWYDRFEKCVESMQPLFGKDKQTEAHLRLYHSISVIWLECGLERSEASYDKQLHRFKVIVDQASELLESLMVSSNEYPQNRCMFEMGVIPPLYFTCIKCRDSTTRQKALALLRKAPKKEGLWSRDEISIVAQRVIEMEEEGLQRSPASQHVVGSSPTPKVYEVSIRSTEDGMHTRAFFHARFGSEDSPLQLWEEILS